MKTPAVLREAAWRIETKHEQYSAYPCNTISKIDGSEFFIDNEHAKAFMSVFSDKSDPWDTSDDYLRNIEVLSSSEETILSLCFAAAIIEAGDAPTVTQGAISKRSSGIRMRNESLSCSLHPRR